MDHPHVLKIHEWFPSEGNLCIVSELCSGGSLFGYATKLQQSGNPLSEEALLKAIFRNIFGALAYCNGLSVVHRDMKHDNVMFHDPESANIRLVDFGCSSFGGGGQMSGTIGYIAPEVVPEPHTYDAKCDVFSVGVMLYEITTAQHPLFKEFDFPDEAYLEKVVSHDFHRKPIAHLPEQLQDLLGRTLDRNPKKRISNVEAHDHPWLAAGAGKLSRSISENAVRNATAFARMDVFQQAILTQVAYSCADDHVKELQETFLAMDKDGNGRLDLDELQQGFSQLQTKFPPGFELSSLDSDESGSISYTEFLAACMDAQALCTDDALRNAFDFFDCDGSGTIDRSELVSYLGDKGADTALGTREDLNFDGFKEVVAKLAKMQMEPTGESSNRFQAIQRRNTQKRASKLQSERRFSGIDIVTSKDSPK